MFTIVHMHLKSPPSASEIIKIVEKLVGEWVPLMIRIFLTRIRLT